VQFVLFIGQETVELLSQEQGLIRGEREQHPLAGLVLDLELVSAALPGRRDADQRLWLQSTRQRICPELGAVWRELAVVFIPTRADCYSSV
jgi:hypothetical protein